MAAFEAVVSLGLAAAYLMAGPVLKALGPQATYRLGGLSALAAALLLLPMLALRRDDGPGGASAVRRVGAGTGGGSRRRGCHRLAALHVGRGARDGARGGRATHGLRWGRETPPRLPPGCTPALSCRHERWTVRRDRRGRRAQRSGCGRLSRQAGRAHARAGSPPQDRRGGRHDAPVAGGARVSGHDAELRHELDARHDPARSAAGAPRVSRHPHRPVFRARSPTGATSSSTTTRRRTTPSSRSSPRRTPTHSSGGRRGSAVSPTCSGRCS